MKNHLVLLLALSVGATPAFAQQPEKDVPLEGTAIRSRAELSSDPTFVSRGDGVASLIRAIGAQLKTPAIISTKVQKKKVEGSFSLRDPRKAMETVGRELGLVWYTDGQALYVYDASELRNAVGRMEHTSVAVLNDFLRRARLADDRYAPRGGGANGTFYVSGPPIYVEVVLNAARYLDELYRGADARAEHVEVIPLQHSFAQGRRYANRGSETPLPGMAEVLAQMLSDAGGGDGARVVVRHAPDPQDSLDSQAAGDGSDARTFSSAATRPVRDTDPGKNRRPSLRAGDDTPPTVVIAYPETNSLIVRGTLSGIQKVKRLVAELDQPRRQVELSLWIIDVNKSQLDGLGVRWSGQVGIAGRLGLTLNGATSTLDGQRFLASVTALAQTGNASIVSRPVLLTQENVLAHFDSNHTFYARLEAERATSLEGITYGTLVSVLPRVSEHGEVEMQLKVEDGTESGRDVEGLPVIARTSIDTVARVPHSLSLLIGGYTRNERGVENTGIPGLSRIRGIGRLFGARNRRDQEQVRLFLIQPRVLATDEAASDGTRYLLPENALEALPEQYRQVRETVTRALHGPD